VPDPAPKWTRLVRTPRGRLRLGWRLLAWASAAGCVAAALGLLFPASLLAGSAALLIGGTVAGWLLLASEGRRFSALGFHLGPSWISEAAYGIGVGAGLALLAVAVIGAAGGVTWSGAPGGVSAWLLGAGNALLFLALPAAAEEVLLRGYPLQALSEAWGAGRALFVTSLAFALAHLTNPGVTGIALLNIGLAGLWLGIVWIRTGSLWWATGAHLGWNWASAYVADLPVSGLELLDAPLYDAMTSGPSWLGGGTFGPEGSVLTAVVLSGGCVWSARARLLRPSEPVAAAGPLSTIGTLRTGQERREHR